MTAVAGLYARGRLPKGVMNATETRFAGFLKEMKDAGKILDWRFEGYTLDVAQGKACRYTPDFAVLKPDGEVVFYEVKGGRGVWMDDAKVKMKVVAANSWHRIFVVFPSKGGRWEFEEV